jgi:hypothetical protein
LYAWRKQQEKKEKEEEREKCESEKMKRRRTREMAVSGREGSVWQSDQRTGRGETVEGAL